jgi:hypothetical protein
MKTKIRWRIKIKYDINDVFWYNVINFVMIEWLIGVMIMSYVRFVI